MRNRFALAAAAAVAAFAAVCDAAQLRAAVYAGPGARGVGMFRWLTLPDRAPEIDAAYVDGAAIRAGALRDADILLMPGGKSNLEEDDLGPEGQKEVRRFIEDGGAYIGTCAGAFLLMRGEKREKTLGIAPYRHRRGSWGGEAMIQVEYTKEAAALSGVKPGKRTERFNGGPVMDPAAPVPGADFKTMATFSGNLHSHSAKPGLPSMGGGASAVAGTFGKGRVWLFSGHPEYYPKTWSSLEAAFKYTTGRDVKFSAPQRKKGQLAVGFCCKAGIGPATAEFVRGIVRDPDFDVEPYSTAEIERTGLQHIDAFVVPDTAEPKVLAKFFAPGSKAAAYMKEFMDRGGKVVAWGRGADCVPQHANRIAADGAAGAIEALRAVKNAPLPPPRAKPAAKEPDAVRAAIYCGPGASGAGLMHWISILELSPCCKLAPVDAAAVRGGALYGADLYVAPGGTSITQAKTLRPDGCSNLVEFVRSGGLYYGTCAGCYLAMSYRDKEPRSAGRIGIVPFEAQKSPYRGGSELLVKFTKDAGMFGLKPGAEASVRYHGGPVPLPSRPVPDADIRAVAEYACDGVYSFSTNTAPTMAGHPAVLAGTVGKGRMVGVSPHPENWRYTQNIVLGGLKYLTGRDFRPDFPQRARGNLSVGVSPYRLASDGGRLVAELFGEASLDVRPADSELISYGALEHCDAIVLVHPDKDTVTRAMREFAGNGGRIFAYGTAAELKNPKDLPEGSYSPHTTRAGLIEALRAYAKEP